MNMDHAVLYSMFQNDYGMRHRILLNKLRSTHFVKYYSLYDFTISPLQFKYGRSCCDIVKGAIPLLVSTLLQLEWMYDAVRLGQWRSPV